MKRATLVSGSPTAYMTSLPAEPVRRVPVFYTSDDSLPRPTALFHGAVIAAAFLIGVCLLLSRGGSFPDVLTPSGGSGNSHAAAFSGLARPAHVPAYFRTLPLLSALDTNHDGVLSAGEISAAPRILPTLDANHDGRLDAVECGGESNGTLGLDPQFLVRARRALMRIHPILAALDADGNGEISSEEIARAPMLLRTLDADDDGRLTINELQPDPVVSAAAQFVSVFDSNSDGALDAAEWAAVSGQHLLGVLRRAAGAHGGMVTDRSLTAGLRFDPATGLRDDDAYREMLNATRQAFAGIVKCCRTGEPHSGKPLRYLLPKKSTR